MPIETAIAASAALISSSAIKYVTVSSPMPSYSSGVHMPMKPSLPSSSITSRAKWCVRSHSAAYGSIFSRANSRASSTTCSRMSVAIDIESRSRFSAEPPGRHHFLQEPRGAVLRIRETVDQHFHDREADVESDQVGERERPERMLHAERHDLIDGFGARDPFLYAQDRLVDHRHQHAVRHEPRGILHHDRRLPELLCKLYGSLDGVARRLWSTYYFYERHQRHRIHEMHADHLAGAIGVLGELGDGDGGVIACQDGAGTREP